MAITPIELTLRNVKGSPVDATENDANLTNLKTASEELDAQKANIEIDQSITYDMLSDADYELTADQNLYGRIEITDTNPFLTTARNIIADNIEHTFLFINSTLQTLTVKTTAGTGVEVSAGEAKNLRNDTVNIVALEGGGTSTPVTPTPILSPATKSQGETIQYILTDTNFGTYTTPVYTLFKDGVTMVDNLDGTFTITPPTYTGAVDIYDITVQCTDGTDTISLPASHTLTVLDTLADTGIVIQDATLNDTTIPTTPNSTITANVLIADADDAVSTTMKYTSGNTNLNLAPTVDNTAINYILPTSDGTTNSSTTDAVPTMTTDSAPSGVASASNFFAGYDPYKGFNDSNTGEADAWLTDSQATGWLQYLFDTAKTINKYTVSARDFTSLTLCPKTWTLEASNTGAFAGEEVVLDTVTNEAVWTQAEKRTYTFTNDTSYLYYRIDITVNQGGGSLTIGEMELIETTVATNTSATVSGQTLTDGDTLLLNDGASTTLAEFDTTGHVTGTLTYNGADNASTTDAIPAMVSTTSPSGLVFASTNYGTPYFDWNAFDDDATTTRWLSASGVLVGKIGYIFTSAKVVNKYTIQAVDNSVTRSPSAWQLQGSNDTTTGLDGTWNNIGSAVSGETAWGASEQRTFTVINSTEYLAYRLDITANAGDGTYVGTNQIEFIEDLSTATIDLTTASLTSAPTTITKDTASLALSIVASAGGDDFVARTPQSHTADDVGGIIVNDEFETILGTASFTMSDFVWSKDRNNATSHVLSNSITGDFYLSSDTIAVETATVPAINSDDISWRASLPTDNASNTDGTITSVTKNNSFMSAVTYAGTGIIATVGHSLASKPDLVIVKNRSAVGSWSVGITPFDNFMALNDTLASAVNTNNVLSGTNSSVIQIGVSTNVNANTATYVAYAFASVAGKCKVGTVTISGGTMIGDTDLGFPLGFGMFKPTSIVGDWEIIDSETTNFLEANTPNTEATNGADRVTVTGDIISNNGLPDGDYIFMAIAKEADSTATKITDIFDIDDRVGEDIKAQTTQPKAGDSLTSIVIDMDKVVV